MSASTQQAQTLPGNGHTAPRKARSAASIAKQKATAARTAAAKLSAARVAPPTQAMTPPTNVAARRIGPVPIAAPVAPGASPGSIAWLLFRQQELEIEGAIIRRMIASFGPRGVVATGTRRAKKRAKRKSPMKQAA